VVDVVIGVDTHVYAHSATSDGLDHDRELVNRCWDLTTLVAEYEAFNVENRPLVQTATTLVGC